jgi:uncharacterized membrane protein YdbT with pleckstrin-like domain
MLSERRIRMSYVQSVLQPGEQVRHTAKLHWIVYWPGLLFLLGAIAAFALAQTATRGGTLWIYLAGVLGLIALGFLLREWFVQWTTEIAVTDRRIIYKEGFIRRSTVEMHMDKVESVDVDQTIMGRLLDYGTVTVKGVGTGFEPLKTIAAPLELRNHITGI